jgi:transcriptional accessory protein Tex/SPT6
MSITLTKTQLRAIIHEELTRTDKTEIRSIVSSELDKRLKSEIKKALEDELKIALKSKASKEEIGDITKKVLKKLYKDISFHHPYIIDRIKI